MKNYLLGTVIIAVLWYLAGSFIAGTFDATTWPGYWKTLIVFFWMGKCLWLYKHLRDIGKLH